MADTDDEPIWYASYGSNCSAARFGVYLSGGLAAGATRPERGARDPRPPLDSAACWLPARVRFLGDAEKWGGGGVAFLDHVAESKAPDQPALQNTSPGRRYLITRAQFEDVAAQESRREVASIPVDTLTPGVVTPIGDGFYDGLLRLDDIDDVPVVTFTSPKPLLDRRTNPPSPAYLGCILRGLLEVHSDQLDTLVHALLAAPGVAAGWTAPEIADLATK